MIETSGTDVETETLRDDITELGKLMRLGFQKLATDLRAVQIETVSLRKDIHALVEKLETATMQLRADYQQDMAELRADFQRNTEIQRADYQREMAYLRTEYQQDMRELRLDFKTLTTHNNETLREVRKNHRSMVITGTVNVIAVVSLVVGIFGLYLTL